jgi:hypothetical protein
VGFGQQALNIDVKRIEVLRNVAALIDVQIFTQTTDNSDRLINTLALGFCLLVLHGTACLADTLKRTLVQHIN